MLDVEQFLLRLDLVVSVAQAFGNFRRHGLLFVEFGLVLEFLACLARCRNPIFGRLDGQIDIGLGLALGKIDILRCGVGIQQRLILAPEFLGVLFQFLLALGFGGGLCLLLPLSGMMDLAFSQL